MGNSTRARTVRAWTLERGSAAEFTATPPHGNTRDRTRPARLAEGRSGVGLGPKLSHLVHD
jgi:hypothetical protein